MATAGSTPGTPLQLPAIQKLQQPLDGVAFQKESSYDIVDISSMKLRLSTLTTEKDFLQKESELLKSRLVDLTTQVNKMEKRFHHATDKNRHLEKEKKQVSDNLHQLTTRCYRAEKIASYLEKQYKEASPNQRVDYSAVETMEKQRLEPSIQLLAALSAQVVPYAYGLLLIAIKDSSASGFNVDVKLAEARMLPVTTGKK